MGVGDERHLQGAVSRTERAAGLWSGVEPTTRSGRVRRDPHWLGWSEAGGWRAIPLPVRRRSRHIGYRLQFVRDAVDYLQTRPHYVGTLAQPADLLTKPGTASSLEQYCDLLGGIGTCPQTRQLFPGLGA